MGTILYNHRLLFVRDEIYNNWHLLDKVAGFVDWKDILDID